MRIGGGSVVDVERYEGDPFLRTSLEAKSINLYLEDRSII